MASKRRILIFSPFQAIPEMSFIQKRVGEILRESGNFDFEVMGCDGMLMRSCSAMRAHRVAFSAPTSDKQAVCDKCRAMRGLSYPRSQRRTLSLLDDFLDREAEQAALDQEISICERLEDYVFDDIPLGRISCYEIALTHKTPNIQTLRLNHGDELAASIGDNLRAYLAMKQALLRKPYDAVVVYNGNYGINNTLQTLVRRSFPRVKPVSIHYGVDWAKPFDTLFLTTEFHQEHLRDRVRFFVERDGRLDFASCDQGEPNRYVEALHRAQSAWVYSAPKANDGASSLAKLGLDPDKPTALMAMGSIDEIFGLRYSVFQRESLEWERWTFPNQVEWLKSVIAHFRERPEFQLVIRIHPREFPNKREDVRSPSAQAYLEATSALPANVKLNVPDQCVSIYDLFDAISLNLTSWSSVGLESSLAGIPTISITDGLSLYPNEWVHGFFEQPESYFAQVDRFLSGARSPDEDLKVRAQKWLLYDLNMTGVRFKTSGYWEGRRTFFQRALRKIRRSSGLSERPWAYRSFRRAFSISDPERQALVEYFRSFRNVWEIKLEEGT